MLRILWQSLRYGLRALHRSPGLFKFVATFFRSSWASPAARLAILTARWLILIAQLL
jgi:hypothetical protein